MEQSTPWEAGSFSDSQEIPHILWNPEVYYRIYLPQHPPLSWARSIHSMPHIPFFEDPRLRLFMDIQ